jgi:hypothetical protein
MQKKRLHIFPGEKGNFFFTIHQVLWGCCALLVVLAGVGCNDVVSGSGGGDRINIDIPGAAPPLPPLPRYTAQASQRLPHGSINLTCLAEGLSGTSISVVARVPVEVTVIPDPSYELEPGTLKFIPSGDAEQAITQIISANTYQFTMPAADLAVSARFIAQPGITEFFTAPQPPLPSFSKSPSAVSAAADGSWELTYYDPAASQAMFYLNVFPQKQVSGGRVELSLRAASSLYRLKNIAVLDPGLVALSGGGNAYSFFMPAAGVFDIQVECERLYPVLEGSNASGLPALVFSPLYAAPGELLNISVKNPLPAGYMVGSDGVRVNGNPAVSLGGGHYTYTTPSSSPVGNQYQVTVNLALLLSGEHNIFINHPANGTISPSAAAAGMGTTITLNLNPAPGFRLSAGGPQVNGGAVALTHQSGAFDGASTWTFTMPDADATVSAAFEPVPGQGVLWVEFASGAENETFSLSGPAGETLSMDQVIGVAIGGGGYQVVQWLFDGDNKTADIRAITGAAPTGPVNSFITSLYDLMVIYGWNLNAGAEHSITAIVAAGTNPVNPPPPYYSKVLHFRMEY